jgi:hypothetical protein
MIAATPSDTSSWTRRTQVAITPIWSTYGVESSVPYDQLGLRNDVVAIHHQDIMVISGSPNSCLACCQSALQASRGDRPSFMASSIACFRIIPRIVVVDSSVFSFEAAAVIRRLFMVGFFILEPCGLLWGVLPIAADMPLGVLSPIEKKSTHLNRHFPDQTKDHRLYSKPRLN